MSVIFPGFRDNIDAMTATKRALSQEQQVELTKQTLDLADTLRATFKNGEDCMTEFRFIVGPVLLNLPRRLAEFVPLH